MCRGNVSQSAVPCKRSEQWSEGARQALKTAECSAHRHLGAVEREAHSSQALEVFMYPFESSSWLFKFSTSATTFLSVDSDICNKIRRR
jgi:hypothetical protein